MTVTTAARRGRRGKKDYRLLFLILPFAIFTLCMNYVPLFGWYIAFLDYKPAISIFRNTFVGLDNFLYMLKDKREILRVLRNTVSFALISYAVSVLPLIFAILLNELRSRVYRRSIQTITTFPYFISWVIVYSLAFQMFSYDGVVSTVLQRLGLTGEPTSMLTNAGAVYWFQSAILLWKELGWSAIIYLAAISGIDQELYEAAAVDGANRARKVVHITLPALLPTFIVLQLLSVSKFVGVGFEQYYMFRNSFVAERLDVIDVYTYIQGLQNHDYAYATAIGVLKSLVSIALLFSTNQLAKKIRGNSIV